MHEDKIKNQYIWWYQAMFVLPLFTPLLFQMYSYLSSILFQVQYNLGSALNFSRTGFPDRFCLIIIIHKFVSSSFLKLTKYELQFLVYIYFVTSCGLFWGVIMTKKNTLTLFYNWLSQCCFISVLLHYLR